MRYRASAKETARLYTYAALKADEDLSVAKDQERRQQAGALYTLLGEKTAWLAPEILELGEAKVSGVRARERGPRQAPRLLPRQHAARRPAYAGPRGRGRSCGRGRRAAAAGLRLSPARQFGAAVSDGHAVERRERASRSVGLCAAPPIGEPRRPQARVRHVLGRVEELRRHARAPCSPRRSWATSSAPRRASTRTRCRRRSFPTTCPKPSIARWSRRRTRACPRCTVISACASACSGSKDRSNITTSIRSCSPASTSRNSPSPIRNA